MSKYVIWSCKKHVSPYEKGKAIARRKAEEWQIDFENHNYSWLELCYWQEYFEKLGKRYGLTKEFKEDGII